MTVAEKMIEQTGVIGEKIQINGFKRLAAPFVGSYIHGNKIAALVGLASSENSAEVLLRILQCKLLLWELLLYLTKILILHLSLQKQKLELL